jgi:hypothetical protein
VNESAFPGFPDPCLYAVVFRELRVLHSCCQLMRYGPDRAGIPGTDRGLIEARHAGKMGSIIDGPPPPPCGWLKGIRTYLGPVGGLRSDR